MAPPAPELPKEKPKVLRPPARTNTTRKPTLNSNSASTIKKTTSSKKTIEKTPINGNIMTAESRVRTNTVAKVPTPKPKENKTVPQPGSVKKNTKKSWQRRPKPAHSGVPVPEKMKRILEKLLLDSDSSF